MTAPRVPRGIEWWPTSLADKWIKEYRRAKQLRNLDRRARARRKKKVT